jgi:hypothetical protein
MGHFKSLDIQSRECETLPYPYEYQEPQRIGSYVAPSIVYGLFANSRLVDLYASKTTADYECYLCKMGDVVTGDNTQYEVLPVKVHNHSPFTE